MIDAALALIAKINREAVRILGLPEVRERLAADGADVRAGTPARTPPADP